MSTYTYTLPTDKYIPLQWSTLYRITIATNLDGEINMENCYLVTFLKDDDEEVEQPTIYNIYIPVTESDILNDTRLDHHFNCIQSQLPDELLLEVKKYPSLSRLF